MAKKSGSRNKPRTLRGELVRGKALAAIETQLRTEIAQLKEENRDLMARLDMQQLKVGGFELELQTRHYEVPFISAQIESLLLGAKFTEPVRHTLNSIRASIDELMKWSNSHPPSLEPASWVALAHKLGMTTNFLSRRMPAVVKEPETQTAA